jgi:cell division protease FtsH
MVARFGMSGALGQMVYEARRNAFLGEGPFVAQQRNYSEDTARDIDLAVRKLVDDAYARAKGVLEQRREELDGGAKLLLEKETLTPAEFPGLESVPPGKMAAQ